jgi:6-pyruvoyl-tetrahydropterin synthase
MSSKKKSIRKPLQLINNFSKVPGYKINSKQSVGLKYTNDKWDEKENREATTFTIVNIFFKSIYSQFPLRFFPTMYFSLNDSVFRPAYYNI